MRPLLLSALALALLAGCPSAEPTKAPAPPPAPEPVTEAIPEPAPEVAATPIALSAGSSLTFSARKNDEVDVAGTFTKLTGQMTVPGGDLSKARGTIEVSWFGGVDTKDPARDTNIVTAFFGALDDTAPKGQVGLNSLEVETPQLDVGASTTGNAFVDVGAGRSMVGLALQVKVERTAEATYTLTVTEPATVSIDALGMTDRKDALMTLCGHKSVGDAVTISGTAVFGG